MVLVAKVQRAFFKCCLLNQQSSCYLLLEWLNDEEKQVSPVWWFLGTCSTWWPLLNTWLALWSYSAHFSTKTSFILGEIPFSYDKSKLLYYLLTTNSLAVLLFNLGEIHLKRQCDSLKEDRHFQGTFDMLWNHVPYPDVLLVWILDMYIKLKHSSVYIHVIDERLSIVVVALFLENHRGQPSYQRGQETQRCTRTGWSGRFQGLKLGVLTEVVAGGTWQIHCWRETASKSRGKSMKKVQTGAL